jgi:hypothetical protein
LTKTYRNRRQAAANGMTESGQWDNARSGARRAA